MTERIELSIAPDYVEWGVWEALRELMQNARDEHDRGSRMQVSWTPSDKLFSVSNQNVALGRATLVLGGTSKRDDPDQRGKFGEGYKLACATLLRLGHAVTIHNRTELWTPVLEFSQTFGAVVLVMKITKLNKPVRDLKFTVSGITKKHYQHLQDNVLFLRPLSNEMLISSKQGTIIHHPDYANKLYVGGIFVCDMPDHCYFGYDFKDLSLDRDRSLANPWLLNRRIAQTFANAVATGQVTSVHALRILGGFRDGKIRWGECRALTDHCEHPVVPNYKEDPDSFNDKVCKEFHRRHGENAIPVTTEAEKMEAAHYGKVGIITSVAVYNIMGAVESNFAAIRRDNATQAKKTYAWDDLSTQEKSHLYCACKLVADHEQMSLGTLALETPEDVKGVVRVVDFKGPYVRGAHLGEDLEGCPAEILLSKSIMNNRMRVISTLVHEVAHRGDKKDGSIEHREAMQTLFGKIIHKLIPE